MKDTRFLTPIDKYDENLLYSKDLFLGKVLNSRRLSVRRDVYRRNKDHSDFFSRRRMGLIRGYVCRYTSHGEKSNRVSETGRKRTWYLERTK